MYNKENIVHALIKRVNEVGGTLPSGITYPDFIESLSPNDLEALVKSLRSEILLEDIDLGNGITLLSPDDEKMSRYDFCGFLAYINDTSKLNISKEDVKRLELCSAKILSKFNFDSEPSALVKGNSIDFINPTTLWSLNELIQNIDKEYIDISTGNDGDTEYRICLMKDNLEFILAFDVERGPCILCSVKKRLSDEEILSIMLGFCDLIR